LVESIRRFQDLFEQSPIGVALYDSKGEILLTNKAYLEVFGISSFGVIQKKNLFKSLLPLDEGAELRSGKFVQYEQECDFESLGYETSREGSGHILFIVSPLLRENKVIAYMEQVQDITERKKIAESQRLAQLGRLLSDIAHEVNNPLMIISGRAELALMDEVKDPELKKTLEVILDQCFLAKDIIQRVLKYARLGKVEKHPLDIAQTLDLILNILDHQFRMSNIELKREIDADLPKIYGNEKQFQEVFMNIIRNSADAMPDGGVIDVAASKNKGFIKVQIKDNGVGIEKDVLSRIFEPFFTTKQKGTGLGLAITYSIIQEHGGELKYDSEIGKGTTATILLPFAD